MARKTDFMRWLWGDLKPDWDLGRKADALVREMKIQQQLVGLREMRRLPQRSAAKLLGASQPYVAKFETGVMRNPGVRTLVKHATALGGRVTLRIDPEIGPGPKPWMIGEPVALWTKVRRGRASPSSGHPRSARRRRAALRDP